MRVASEQTAEVQEKRNEELRMATSRAWRAGCRDGMLHYLHSRIHEGKAEEGLGTPLEIVEAKLKAGEELLKSPYPKIRKAYGQLRAAQQLTAYVRATENTGAYRAEKIPVLFMDATLLLKEALEEPGIPEQEVVEVCNDLIHGPTTRSGLAVRIWSELSGPLQRNYSTSGTAQFIKGDFYVDYAWQARGNGG